MKLSMFGEAITMNKAKLLGIAMALTVLGTSVNVVSATEDTKLEMPYDVYTWTETVDAVVKKNDDSTISVHCDTKESEELYNYITVSTIFDGAYDYNGKAYDEKYKGIAIELVNTSDVELQMDFILVDKDNNKLVLKEDEFVIVETNNEKYVKKLEFAAVKLEPKFSGIVYIPFNVMVQSDVNTNDMNMDKLTSWAVGLLLEKNNVLDLNISSMSWILSDFTEQYTASLGAFIEGDDTIMIPEHGESISFLKINKKPESNYKFVLGEYTKGFNLDENGKITVTTECEPKDITIRAVDDNGTVITKKISLATSWRDGSDKFVFNGPEDLDEVTYPFKNVTKESIKNIRNVIIVGISVVFLSYIVFYVKYKIDKKREERK